jgi:hypothetical protein
MKKLILYKELKKDSPFYEVKDPAVAKQRVELQSWNPIAMALLAQKIAEVPAILSIQQSDYVVAWSNTGNWTTHVNRFMKFHRYLPSWTHRWMHRFSYIRTYGFRGLSNKRVYRKVTL